jgi:hypothetical protein
MNNFEKWRNALSIDMFIKMTKGIPSPGNAIINIPCRLCPAVLYCRDNYEDNCFDIFEEWANKKE